LGRAGCRRLLGCAGCCFFWVVLVWVVCWVVLAAAVFWLVAVVVFWAVLAVSWLLRCAVLPTFGDVIGTERGTLDSFGTPFYSTPRG